MVDGIAVGEVDGPDEMLGKILADSTQLTRLCMHIFQYLSVEPFQDLSLEPKFSLNLS